MSTSTRYVFLLLALFAVTRVAGQGQGNWWYFGQGAGVNFNTSPPTAVAGSLTTQEGCSSISTPQGNLLMYTDGVTVYTQTHTVMANGNGLAGDQSTSQSALIVKQPGNTSIYYIFTMGVSGVGSLHYSVVDMSLSAGMGSVTVKNTYLYGPCLEKLAAVKHSNNQDVWVLVHENGNSTNYRAYLLTATGVSTTAVISSVGTSGYHQSNLRASPDGQKIATGVDGGAELYDFNRSTGTLSNPVFLSLLVLSTIYGCEFSPDGTKLYGSEYLGGRIYQWNICAGSSTAIAASMHTIAANGANAMQLASNGKIYVAKHMMAFLGVINNPNAAGNNCNYADQGFTLTAGYSRSGLPNFVSSLFMPPAAQFTVTTNGIGCLSASFTAPPTQSLALPGCAALTTTLTGYHWNFGDPLSGSANTSTATNPVHAFSGIGTYTTSLILSYSNNFIDTIQQVVNITDPCITVSSTSITCASLGSATVAVVGALGPFSYTWTPTAQTGSVATGLSPGTYTITIFDAGKNNTYTAQTVFTSLIPLTGTLSNQDSLLCFSAANGTATIHSLTGGSGSQHYLWTNGISSYTQPLVSTLSAGTWSATVTDLLTGCQVNSQFQIFQPSAVSITVASSSPSVCMGGSISFTALASGGTPLPGNSYGYQWAGGQATSTMTVNKTAAGNYIYTVNVTDANNCVSTQTTALDFVSYPTITVANVSICPLETGTLTATGANNYTWSTGSNNASATDNPLATTVYTVTGEALACTSTTTASIILKNPPLVLIYSNSPRCEGSPLNFITNGGSAFLWDGPQSFTSTAANPVIDTILPAQAGVYHVTVTAANSCTGSASHTVAVNPTPTLSANGSTVCSSQTLLFNVSSVPGASFQWNGPDSFNSTQQNPALPSPSLSATGDYTVKVTDVLTCTNSAVVNAKVVAPPSLTITLSSPSLCAQALSGSPNMITFTNTGANSYTLLTGPPISNSDPTNTTVPVSTNPPFQPTGIATATLMGSNGICTVAKTATFSIVPNPTIGVNSFTPVICAGESFTYTSDGANSYVWNGSTPNYTTWSNGGVAVANPSINSVLSVYGSSLGCNSALLTTTITVNPIPMVSVDPVTTAICKFSTATLQASGTATEFSWLPNVKLNTTKGEIITASPEQNQTYTVIGSALTCTNSATATVEVLALPVPKANLSRPTICLGDEITLTGNGGVSYEWYGPGGLTYKGSPVTFILDNPAFVGEYTVIATDANGCKGSAKTTINVHPLPQGTLLGNFEGCVQLCENFQFKGLNNEQVSAVWTIGNKTFPQNFSHCFTTPGEYVIKGQVSDQATNCKVTQSFVVTVHEKPRADFTWNPEKPVEGLENVLLQNNSIGKDQTSWNWYMQHDKSFTSDNESTSYFFQNAGSYPIVYVVENKWGCADTAIKVLTIETDFALFVPDAFTPNADSRNESFKPVVRGVKKYYFQVFNRWGERLFVTENPEEGWDGSFQSRECKQDSYLWKIVLSTTQGEQKEYTGSVVLIR